MKVTLRVIVLSIAACAGVTALAAWIFDLKPDRAAALSPVIVLGFGAAAALVVLWTRVIVDSIRGPREPDE